MKHGQRVTHEFVEFIPEVLAPETIYISGTYATCSHLCLCGCGNKVVTPLAPDEWQLFFDGEAVSLSPSIGNWSYGCQSHYWIEDGRVIWARSWSRERINENRVRDRHLKERRYARGDGAPAEETAEASGGWLSRVGSVLGFRRRS